ncbi:DUF6169 family protein [Dyadobacter sp. CY356]|uniref:DUF6169 family protein n=1 Tax=Dyadobacter sp. CY356 TaxID=2906442 RepID=UPI001F3C2B3C|nr:DUF6169 family protein [Dyadobacter sp. CY356]MCF0057251.1 DUF6169 family protein [Dyadobacter sp. CY356]
MSFGFSLVKESEKKQQNDKRIRDTIITIVGDYLMLHPETALFIVCDTSDNRHVFRNNLFLKWFDQFNPIYNLNFSKYDLRICNEDDDCAYCSLIMNRNCIEYLNIKKAFLNLDNDLIAKGY